MEIDSFYLVGINYKKTEVSIRSKFAIAEAQYKNIIENAKSLHLENLFVLATCNRTEIYGVVPSPDVLTNLLCEQTEGDVADFQEISYTMTGREAATHLFTVAAGLDSQILGDYEILGQLKNAVKFAKSNHLIGNFLERLTNTSYQSSKEIKNKTELSGGTISVAFAAIQFMKWHLKELENKKFLLIGTGEIGVNTAKNIVDYLETRNIQVANRTRSKAEALAKELGCECIDFADIHSAMKNADVIITATAAPTPIVDFEDIKDREQTVLIDLSVPNNINTNVRQHPAAILVNVDELSKISSSTFANRAAQIPKAMEIIESHLEEFDEWQEMRKNVPVIKAAQKTLEDIHNWALASEMLPDCPDEEHALKKAIQRMATHMREYPHTEKRACSYFQAITDYFKLSDL